YARELGSRDLGKDRFRVLHAGARVVRAGGGGEAATAGMGLGCEHRIGGAVHGGADGAQDVPAAGEGLRDGPSDVSDDVSRSSGAGRQSPAQDAGSVLRRQRVDLSVIAGGL